MRLAEAVGALSLATDLATGQPLEHALRRGLLAVWLGDELGLTASDLNDVYYVAILGTVGCAIEGTVFARYGDDIALSARAATIDAGRPVEVAAFGLTSFGAGEPPLRRAAKVASGAIAGTAEFRAVCRDVAVRVADMIDVGPAIQQALAQCHERWDGSGGPQRLQGDAIHPAARIFHVAHDVEIQHRMGGMDAALRVVRRRSGRQYDPDVAGRFQDVGQDLLYRLQAESGWDATLAAEPAPLRWLGDDEVDEFAAAVATFVDVRSPYTLGHSAGVANLAEQTAQGLGLGEAEVIAVRRAGLLHDLGRTGVPVAMWNKEGSWTADELARAHTHPALTEMVLSRSPALGPLGALAGLHHERLDGSGYRGMPASFLPLAARILATADAYRTKIEPRPHRGALQPDAAAQSLRRMGQDGKLDADVVKALLVAAGHRTPRPLSERPFGLSAREIEVLSLVVRGLSNREMAAALFISPKTVGHHVQHIYDKTGVSTRVGATLLALQHGLVDAPPEA